MAKGIPNYGNVDAPDATWLSGKIRDNNGTNNGTRFNAANYQDIHQTFMKFIRDSFTTLNNLFDNEANGYQYYNAIRDLFGHHRKVNFKQGVGVSTLIDTDYSPIVIIKSGAAAGHTSSLQTPGAGFTGKVVVANYSANNTNVADQAGTNNLNGAAGPYVLPSMQAVEFTYSVGNWVLNNRWKL